MKTKFSWRAFISFGLTWGILVILVSGVILYVAPPGRYAHWVNWELAGLSKEGWQAVHTLFSLAFIVLSVFHLFSVNWKSFVSYLKSKSTKGFNKKKELIFSIVVVLVFFFGTVFSIPPFQTVMDLSETATNSWEKTEERAPVPHAELLTLTELAQQLDLDSVDAITRKLDTHKIAYNDIHTQSLQQIAGANNSTPLEIYEIIVKQPGNAGQGMGVGRKTLDDFSKELNKSTDELMQILEKNNIAAKPTETLRAIGENNDVTPRDIYKLLSE
ncbi:DUF4405 domain-containing protein [Draconibacterium sediminis]|uniref:Flavinylation-associated cytochrome domain-containing protein n=1 Tax=Draconibacterium sediminis TaxID=1544798 RepID=A0A0D8J7T5_9BACT|nr:DUF4405 domain-containing protein [Draconibacterium sediminis]KJF42942.1 hypothetical protein LH29_16215 [Draconibacterium sediminis]